MAAQPPSVMQSRYRPFGVQTNPCGHAAEYNQIARYKFLGLTPPAPPASVQPPDAQNPNF